ncbi:MAG: trehalose-phosphatase [Bauldia sp.]|nr:trehalose-phosphatase [Bauldia sp.]
MPRLAHATTEGAPFHLPAEVAGWAFFIDIDGTLIDIAPTPEAVFVPPWLPAALERLTERLGGALALVSGRAIAGIDDLLAPARLAAAGLHGDELRFPGEAVETQPAPPALARLRPRLAALVAGWPGAFFEDKGSAIAVHYRGNPEAGPAIIAAIDGMIADFASELSAQPGKMVVEIKPARAGKDKAVRALMARPPFLGRRPLVLGDDFTDETMFRAANDLGGVAIRVGHGDRPTEAAYHLPDPQAVREWIAELAETPA